MGREVVLTFSIPTSIALTIHPCVSADYGIYLADYNRNAFTNFAARRHHVATPEVGSSCRINGQNSIIGLYFADLQGESHPIMPVGDYCHLSHIKKRILRHKNLLGTVISEK